MKSKLFLMSLILLMTSCVKTVNVEQCLPETVYGFWGGFWHGLIFIFSAIGSILIDEVSIYAVNNTGGWYDFGFILGILVLYGGGISSNVNKK